MRAPNQKRLTGKMLRQKPLSILVKCGLVSNSLKEMRVLLKTNNSSMKRWSFPDGTKTKIPTWIFKKGGFAIGLSTKRRVRSGRPIFVAIKPPDDLICPTVEINIPIKRNSRVNGCFAYDEQARTWLCHRGSRLTVNRIKKRLKKQRIHRHFEKKGMLRQSHDGEKTPLVIPVAVLESGRLQEGLERFAKHAKELKEIWVSVKGDDAKIRRILG